MIIAKPVIPDQYWILKQDDKKIGNIESGPQGYNVRINNQVINYKSLDMLQQRVPVDFQEITATKVELKNEVHGFPTDGPAHNAIFDVRQQLPLWTKEERSKSWFAAGWYRVKIHRNWQVANCPKLIVLQRYQYQGPYATEIEAKAKPQ